jgi:APA family basic amino acid/polyamine antiporter
VPVLPSAIILLSLTLRNHFRMAEKSVKQGQLVRGLTLGAATILIVSSVIGSGVYKKVAPMADSLGSPVLVLLCWVLAGVVSIFGALSNAEVAGMLADSGGEYAYFKRIYGKFMAFLYGWSAFTVIKSAAVASIAYVFAQSFHSIIPLPHFNAGIENINLLGIFKPFENFGVKAFTILLICSLTFLNTRGLKGGSMLSSSITRLMLVGLGLIVIAGLFFGGGSFSNITTPSATHTPGNWTDFSVIKAIFGAMLAAFWAYEGWNLIGFVGGEVKNPNRNIPLSLFGGMAIIITAYLLVNFTYLYVLPVDQIIDVYKSQNEIAAVAVLRHFAGNPGALALSLLILLTTFGCTNTTILMPPRIYYAMSRDKLFFPGAADIHPKFNTPNKALWIQAIWASLLVLSGSFDQLTDMLVFAAFFFYGATALGVFILRIREPQLERPYRVWGYPVVPALFILFCLALVVITFFTRPREAGLGVMLMLTGVPFYLYWNRENRRN